MSDVDFIEFDVMEHGRYMGCGSCLEWEQMGIRCRIPKNNVLRVDADEIHGSCLVSLKSGGWRFLRTPLENTARLKMETGL